jgi:chaperonin GroES
MSTTLKNMHLTAEKILQKNIFHPVSDSLIVYRMKLDKTAGGIVLPESASQHGRGYGTTGLVLAVGPGKFSELTAQRIPMPCMRGDYILFSSIAGLELGEVVRAELGEEASFEEIRLLRASDVIAKLDWKAIK